MAPPTDITPSAIGKKIHDLRKQRHYSLREMAAMSGLTASFLSQVERGIVNISIDSLRRITNSLNVPMASLLEMPAQPAPRSGATRQMPRTRTTAAADRYSPVVRAGNRPALHFPDPGVSYELLTGAGTRSFVAFLSRLMPGTEVPARPLPEATEQFVHVTEGSLRIEFVGDSAQTLLAGDALTFDGTRVFKFVCAGSSPCVALFVISPPVF